jgi:hypothetical protein
MLRAGRASGRNTGVRGKELADSRQSTADSEERTKTKSNAEALRTQRRRGGERCAFGKVALEHEGAILPDGA